MSDLIFRISQNIVLGSYTISRLPQNVKVWGSRFMIVMDPVLKEVGLQDKVLQPLLERKIEYFIYENITDGANTTGARSRNYSCRRFKSASSWSSSRRFV